MQQSAAFKILRTRLKTVPSYSLSEEQLQPELSGSPLLQSNNVPSGSYVSDGQMNEDVQTLHSDMNFPSRLQQFEKMQKLHRAHTEIQGRTRYNSATSSKV